MQGVRFRTVVASVAWWIAAAACGAPPNILVILADDLGWSDLGCYGGEIRTPHLDRLAAGGLRFTQCYNSSRCSPSRASLLTGLYPHQAGLGRLAGVGGERLPGYRGRLADRCATLAETLAPAGYATFACGKWHVGEPGPFFATDAITDRALDFLTAARAAEKPWLLYVAYQAPHFPLQAPVTITDRYVPIYDRGWDALRAERLARMKVLGLVPNDLALPPREQIDDKAVARRLGSMTADGRNPAWDSLDARRRADLVADLAARFAAEARRTLIIPAP